MSITVPISCRRFVCGMRLFPGLQGKQWMSLRDEVSGSPAITEQINPAGGLYPSPGSYVSMATPVVLISLFTRFKGIFGPSRNRRFPVPSTIGSTHRS